MSLREEQCNKVCRILDNVLANRPTERDSLIVAVRKAFDAMQTAEPKRGEWLPADSLHHGAPFYICSECGKKMLYTVMGNPRWNYCPHCGTKMEVANG